MIQTLHPLKISETVTRTVRMPCFQTHIQMILFLILALVAVVNSQAPDLDTLQAELINTHSLINLYQQKLLLLQQLHQHHYPQHPLPQLPAPASHSLSPLRVNPHLTLLKHINSRVTFLPKQYLLSSENILSNEDYSKVGEFLGEVVLAEEDSITTLVGGKLSMTKVTRQNCGVSTEEVLLGTKAELLPSVWQRNFNIKDAEDILLQWEHDTLFLRGRESRKFKFEGQSILTVYPINQYKVVVVTTQAIHLLNSRSLQLSPPLPAANITRQAHPQSAQIVAVCRTETVMVLLSSGQLARYANERILMSQQLGHLKGELPMLAQHTSIHVVDDRLFVVDHLSGQARVFGGTAGRFIFQQAISLPQHQDEEEETTIKYEVYKVRESIRLLESTTRHSNIYEVMLPHQQQPYYTGNYLKILGVLAVVAGLLYFKFSKKNQNQSQPKPQMLRPTRQELQQQQHNQLRYASEMEEYLKKKEKPKKS